MSKEKEAQPAEPQLQAANKGVAAVLSDEGLRNLAGFFDVLIQMDLAQKQCNEIGSKEDGRREKNKDNGAV